MRRRGPHNNSVGDTETKMRRLTTISVVLVVLVPTIIAAGLALCMALAPKGSALLESLTYVGVSAVILISAVGVLMIYLGSTRRIDYSRDRLDNLEETVLRLASTWHSIEDTPSVLSAEDRTQLVMALKTRLETDSAQQVLDAIREQAEVRASQSVKIEAQARRFSDLFVRLQGAIEHQNRQVRLNLSVGAVVTVAGLFVLGYYVFGPKPLGDDPWLFTSHFLPRLTLVVFIEIFGYFFLRLYKSSLGEIKYFQNEMTNLESRSIALATAMGSLDKEAIAEVVMDLSKTERNRILEKGQTTAELERGKTDSDVLLDVLAKVLNILEKKLK
jgi:hypothetical protein